MSETYKVDNSQLPPKEILEQISHELNVIFAQINNPLRFMEDLIEYKAFDSVSHILTITKNFTKRIPQLSDAIQDYIEHHDFDQD